MLSDSYYWGDLTNKRLTVNRVTPVYDLPDTKSAIVGKLNPGDTTAPLYSYVKGQDGLTYMMFYLTPNDFDNFQASYIPLIENKLSSTVNAPTGVLTVEQQQAQNEWNNLTLFEKVIKVGKPIAITGAVLLGLNIISKFTKHE